MAGIPEIDIHEAKKRLDQADAVFVDVRDGGSFDAAHIKGATNVNSDNVQTFIDAADKARTVIVYCYHGHSSRMGAGFLREKGFAEVFSMSGGFEAWRGVYPHESRPR